MRRVVVTGIGVASPLGCTVNEFWTGLLEGRSGVVALDEKEYAGLRTRMWPDDLPAAVEVGAVQLPGRGSRMKEAPFTRLNLLVPTLIRGLLPHLEKPFAFFGHSMGALVGFESARQLRAGYGRTPVHLFVSGQAAPDTPSAEPPIHALPEGALLDALRRLNGTPVEVLEQKGLMELLLPTLRADLAVCETYVYATGPQLSCPITVFGGLQDYKTDHDRLEAWRRQTSVAFSRHMLPGDHFFIHTARSLVLQTISRELGQAESAITSEIHT